LNTGTITTLDNTGTIKHGSPGADAIDSVGSIATLSNSGQILGAVELLGGSGDTLDNLGRISGNVMLAAGDLLMNQGQVYGDVTLGRADTFTNTGAIQGNLTLGASDTINDSGGAILGVISASNSDIFNYAGLFCNETIDNFVVSGSTHDTIQFAGNDFSGFQPVHHAISRVGSDTVIRLDATDSTTLVGVTKSSLVAADFKFV
jgi:serralysin